MKLITLVCSGISSLVLYVAMFVMLVLIYGCGFISDVLAKVTDCLDYFLNDQIKLFDETLNNKAPKTH